ncbi:MAG: hypothetical protein ACLRWH_05905 [Emergencia sp.]|nr:hypothetical protein [Emergencia sp.]
MNQEEKRIFLIKELLKKQLAYKGMEIPQTSLEQKRLLRALFNVRMPQKADREFLQIQDAYLQKEIADKGITDYHALSSVENGINRSTLSAWEQGTWISTRENYILLAEAFQKASGIKED